MPKDTAFLDWLRIERSDATPLHLQVGRQLRAAILDDRLPAGTALPSSRILAQDLSISRGTVTSVYDRLLAEGLLEVRGRSATLVADGARQRVGTEPAVEAAADDGEEAVPQMQSDGLPPPYPAFVPGTPAFDVFPAARWARLLSARSRQMSVELAGEGMHVGGYHPLRVALAAHLRAARGIRCEPEQIIVVSSARAALATVCRLFTVPGDCGLVEDPGYFVAGRLMRAFGLETVHVPVDAGGMVVEPALPSARLAYVTPTYQMPLGVRLADDRCAALLEWARREEAWIVEDDYDSEFRYVGQPVVALHRSDPNGRVIYIGTFAKTMFPGLRIAFLVIPKDKVSAAERAVFLNGQEPPLHVQAALSDFIAHGHYAAHIRQARSVYRRRQSLLIAALNRHLEGIASLSTPSGGMHVVVPLPPEIPAPLVQEQAARQSLHARALSYYAECLPTPNALHLGFAAVPDRLIEPSVRRLAGVIRSIRLDR